jgi:hypothetical protein
MADSRGRFGICLEQYRSEPGNAAEPITGVRLLWFPSDHRLAGTLLLAALAGTSFEQRSDIVLSATVLTEDLQVGENTV